MITTVTTVTTMTITAFAIGASLGGLAVAALLLLIGAREVTSTALETSGTSRLSWALSKYTLGAIIPLLVVFVVIIIARIFSIF